MTPLRKGVGLFLLKRRPDPAGRVQRSVTGWGCFTSGGVVFSNFSDVLQAPGGVGRAGPWCCHGDAPWDQTSTCEQGGDIFRGFSPFRTGLACLHRDKTACSRRELGVENRKQLKPGMWHSFPCEQKA